VHPTILASDAPLTSNNLTSRVLCPSDTPNYPAVITLECLLPLGHADGPGCVRTVSGRAVMGALARRV